VPVFLISPFPEHLSVGTHEKNIDDMLKRREQITPIIK
jgi:hypothetical protein